MSAPPSLESEITQLREAVTRLERSVGERFFGHSQALELLLYALLADGHVLLEGAPGLGKTTLVKSLARALDLGFRRIQFTPDLMPADILGTRMLEEDAQGLRRFTFLRGPVFCHVLLADEINRATPRTQAALLEAMQEKQVTIFGDVLSLEQPFIVIATQNPIEMEGTYPLPEAQIDRFLLKIELHTPRFEELVEILSQTTGAPRTDDEPVLAREQLLRLRALVRDVPASSDMLAFVARLVLATHPLDASAPESVRRFVRYGSSPRGGQALLLAAKARALTQGRLHVTIDDLAVIAPSALRHRLIRTYEGEAAGISADELVADAVERARKG